MELTIERGKKAETIMISGASQTDILPGNFRNFRGEKRKSREGKIVNDEGVRNFNLALNLPTEALDDLASLGLNIKELAPKDEEYGDQPLRFAKVNVAYGGKFPPEMYLVSNGKMKELTQNELGLLDGARFSNVDLIVRTYHKDENSCTLYLQKGYFTIELDPISAKYADMALDESGFIDSDDEPPFD
jgi:hypothetical protein